MNSAGTRHRGDIRTIIYDYANALRPKLVGEQL
jgi:hypothetical protein